MSDESSIASGLDMAGAWVNALVAMHHSKFVWVSVTIIGSFAVLWGARYWKLWRAQAKYLKALSQADEQFKDLPMHEKDTLAIYALKMFFHLKRTTDGQRAPTWDVAMEAEKQAIQTAEDAHFQKFEAFAYALLPIGLGCTVLGLIGVMNAPVEQFRSQLATKLFFTFIALSMHVISVLMLNKWREKVRAYARLAVERAVALEAIPAPTNVP